MFKTLYLAAICLLFSLASTASGADQNMIKDETVLAMQEQLVKAEQRFGVVGQSVRILKNGVVIFEGQQGVSNIQLSVPVNGQNKFPAYSVSKLFTNVLLMQLVEEERLDIDKSIRHYLPSLPESWQRVSVAHAWNHMSGLPEFFSLQLLDEGEVENRLTLLESVREQPFEYETGTQSSYNQTGFMVMTAILEKMSGKSHAQLVDEVITTPLNLSNTGYAGSREIIDAMVTSYSPRAGKFMTARDLNWPTYTHSITALYSTPEDLTNFMDAVYNGYFVNAHTLKKLWKPLAKNNGQSGSFAQGWNWGKSGQFKYVGHTGGNIVKLRQYYTDGAGGDTYTIAYLTNGNRAGVYVDRFVDDIMAHLEPEQFVKEKFSADLNDLAFLSADETQFDALVENFMSHAPDGRENLNAFLNQKAYSLMSAAGVDKALPIFELNARQFPNSANAWDSLAEAWATSGDTENAILFYEKALRIDPSLESAIQGLGELR